MSYVATTADPASAAKAMGFELVAAEPNCDVARWQAIALEHSKWTILHFPDLEFVALSRQNTASLSKLGHAISRSVYDVPSYDRYESWHGGDIVWSIEMNNETSSPILDGAVPARYRELVEKYNAGLRFNRKSKLWVEDTGRGLVEKLYGKPANYDHFAPPRLLEEITGYDPSMTRQYEIDGWVTVWDLQPFARQTRRA